jgi:hypothetical protein
MGPHGGHGTHGLPALSSSEDHPWLPFHDASVSHTAEVCLRSLT